MRVPFLLAVAAGQGDVIISAIDHLYFVPAGQQSSLKQDVDDGPAPTDRVFYERTRDGTTALLEFFVWRVQRVNEQGDVEYARRSLSAQSTGIQGKWDFWLIMPEGLDFHLGPRALRKFRRVVQSAANTNAQGEKYLLGGLAFPAASRRWPALYSLFFGNKSWPIFAGDRHDQHEAFDYVPTDQDCVDDVEAVEPEPEPE